MNSQQFLEFLNDPGSTNARSLSILEDIVKRYPYCQSGHLLYTYNLFREDDPQYPAQLKKAAAYAGDRKILKALIGLGKKGVVLPKSVPDFPIAAMLTDVSEVKSPDTAPLDQVAAPAPPKIDPVQPASYSPERLTQQELLAIVKKRLAEITAEKNPDYLPDVTKKALIDKFILEEPRMSKPKTSFFSPTDSAIRSNFDDEEIVSETLAQLYAKQGNIQKAIHIYEKLSLLNQEKSRYFASQIKNLST